MQEYYKRNFTRALSLFRDVQRILPTDDPAGMLIQRTQGYLKTPPPATWNGVVEMTEK